MPPPIACIPNGVVVHRTVGSWSFTLTGGEDIYICNTKENTTGKDGQHFALSCVGQRIGLFKYAKGKLSPQVCFPAMEEIMQLQNSSSYTEAKYVICGPYHLRFHEDVVVIWRHERNIFIELPSGSNGWWRFRTYDGVRYF